jgi:hypothetical protein
VAAADEEVTVTRFSLELSQNKYLSTSDHHMHAVLTVRAEGVAARPRRPAAEVLVVDCSSSMDWPPTKITSARRAAAAAIDALPDGTWFAVVEGTHKAKIRFPDTPMLVQADADTRARAQAVAARLIASGGTAMSTWLAGARQLLDQHPDTVRHALLLTDGRNESETTGDLQRELDACEGRFVCDTRGIGDDWEPAELRRIAGALRGTADAVLEETALPAEFRRIIQAVTEKTVPGLGLRIYTPAFARVEFLRQVAPTEIDLTGEAEGGVLEVATGAWGEEAREYHLCLAIDLHGRPRYEDVQLGRVELVPPDGSVEVPAAPVPICGHITEDERLSTHIDEMVERYTVQADLGRHLRAGWARFGEDDAAGAAAEWAKAVELARRLGNDEVLRRLGRLVDIDPDTGEVAVKDSIRPRDGFSAVLSFASDMASNPSAMPAPAGPPRKCPNCTKLSPPDAVVCMACGRRLGEVAP